MPIARKSDAPAPGTTARAVIEINPTDHRTLRTFIVVSLHLAIKNNAVAWMFTTEQIFILNVVMMELDSMERRATPCVPRSDCHTTFH